ncbi:hypothetical protein [Bosea lathyri]|uniref:hypothetical protein n=1 Tax=Bosea lathyri TaxID=1036778 RepID=UPI0011B01CB8|nr:hypothetical protein [Bosea lathyri]
MSENIDMDDVSRISDRRGGHARSIRIESAAWPSPHGPSYPPSALRGDLIVVTAAPNPTHFARSYFEPNKRLVVGQKSQSFGGVKLCNRSAQAT